MRLTPQSIRCVGDGLIIQGPQGPVSICIDLDSITAQYEGIQLVNGSAIAYAKSLLRQALELSENFHLAWRIEPDGSQCITDHARYYEQTFNRDLQGIEFLKRWKMINTARLI